MTAALSVPVPDSGWLPAQVGNPFRGSAYCRIKDSALQMRTLLTRNFGPITVGDEVFRVPVAVLPTDARTCRIAFQGTRGQVGYLALDTSGVATVAQVSGETVDLVTSPVSIPLD